MNITGLSSIKCAVGIGGINQVAVIGRSYCLPSNDNNFMSSTGCLMLFHVDVNFDSISDKTV